MVVLDDDAIFLETWEDSGLPIFAYTQPEDFFAALATDPSLKRCVACVVTDYKFDGQGINGVDVAKRVSEQLGSIPILLLTDYDNAQFADQFRYVMAKNDPRALQRCREILRATPPER